MACGKIIRYCLKQLEDAGLVALVKYQTDNGDHPVGKILTKKGITDMDRIATQISKELSKH